MAEHEETGLARQEVGGVATLEDAKQITEFRTRLDNFTRILNRAPEKTKIKTHQGYEYLPISTVEKDLDKVYFGLVQYEQKEFHHVLNEVVVTARIKVWHPVINQWLSYDGIGSAVIQQNADTKISDFMYNKKPNALQLAAPKAYAEAIKNAAKKIGKRFGADINRKFEDVYTPNFKDDDNKPLN